MKVYIKEWSNSTATIMTTNGQVVWTFSSVAEARQACHDWQSIIYTGNAGCHENSADDAAESFFLA